MEGELRTNGMMNCQTRKGPRVSREKFALRAMMLSEYTRSEMFKGRNDRWKYTLVSLVIDRRWF